MATINLSPTVLIDLITKKQDRIDFDFSVTDEQDSPINLSGYTSAKLTIRNNELTSEVISFTNTGTTYQIDISGLGSGEIVVSCDSLAIDAGDYYYDLQLSNATQIITVMAGKFTVTDQITI